MRTQMRSGTGARVHHTARHSKYGIDPARIAVGGGSAGAHLALLVGFTAGKKFEPESPYAGVSNAVAAVLDFYGPVDLFAFPELDADGRPTGRLRRPQEKNLPAFGPPPGRDAALTAASPHRYVGAKSPPVLLAHGRDDPLVPWQMSEHLAAVLKHHGVAHEFVLMEGVGHSFNLETGGGKPLPRPLTPIVLEFLARHLGNARR